MSIIERFRKNERGQSLAEFTVMLVVLMVLLAGIVDASRAFFTYLAMRDAAQEGALYGSTYPTDTNGIRLRVQHTSTMIENIWGDLTVTPTVIGSPCLGNAIQVDVDYNNFPLTMPFIGTFVGSQTIPISASIIDTILKPPCP